MAVFDDGDKSKGVLDDSENLRCVIEAAENVQGHTVYSMKVSRECSPETTWQVTRRYSDFDALNNLLLCSGLDLPLPPKKVFGKLEREFVVERQQGLQTYINFLLNHPLLSVSIHVKKFLDPRNYSFNFLETALQHVSMVFRSEPDWEVVEPIQDFGWRIRKQYFLVKHKKEPKKQFISSWATLISDNCLSEKDLTIVNKQLGGIQHPHIYPTSMSFINSSGVLVIYEFLENGTLRDVLYKAKPRMPFLKKYGNPKSHATFETQKIKLYGYQILSTLKFLHERGFYHGHLHSGNIAIIDNRCKLLDIMNGILGVGCLLRSHFVHIKKIQTLEDIDVYCFGHLIYEMAFGSALNAPYCDKIPTNCDPELRSVLEAILTKEACKNNIPSISDLLQHAFFSRASNHTEKVHLKVSSQVKDILKSARENAEKRLKIQQKAIRHAKRLSKVQSQLNLDDEKKKRLRKKVTLDLQANGSDKSQTSTPPGMTPNRDQQSDALQSVPQPPAPPPPPPPPPPISAEPSKEVNGPLVSPSSDSSTDRSALLSSIQSFKKDKLKKAETKDCSSPAF